jgi:hypothetical protein
LKLAQLPQWDRVSEMDVDASWVDAVLDAEWAVHPHGALELFDELGFRDDLVNSAFQN